MNVQTAWSTRLATIVCHVALAALALTMSHTHMVFAESLVTPAAAQAETDCCDQRASNAIDRDLGTAWNSGHEPPAAIFLTWARSVRSRVLSSSRHNCPMA